MANLLSEDEVVPDAAGVVREPYRAVCRTVGCESQGHPVYSNFGRAEDVPLPLVVCGSCGFQINDLTRL